MNADKLNPFIRFCKSVSVVSSQHAVCGADCRIFYILSGRGSIFVQNQHCQIKKDSLFFCRGGIDYAINVDDSIQLYSVNFDLTQNKSSLTMPFPPFPVGEAPAPAPVDLHHMDDCDYLNGHIILQNAIEYKAAIENIASEFRGRSIFYAEKSSALLKGLLIDMHRSSIAGIQDAGAAVSRVLKYIHSHYTTKIENQQLAQLTGYHQYHLNRIFAKVTGSSIHQYILNLRMNHAENLVLNTDISMSTICEYAGFNNITHFSNYFKKTFGLSPAQYRAKFKGKV